MVELKNEPHMLAPFCRRAGRLTMRGWDR